MTAYQEDLAYIHESGYTQLANGAVATLLEQLVRSDARSKIAIDLGCGGGTLAAQLDAAGYRVVGYDLSEAMVAMARQRVPEATFHTGSFVDVEFTECVAVTAIGEVFNYLFDGRNDSRAFVKVLENIFSSLHSGGMLLFDMAGPGRAPTEPTTRFVDGDDWSLVVTAWESDRTLTRQITAFRRIGDSYRRSDETHRLRLVDANFAEQTLTSIGFEVRRLDRYGDAKLPEGLQAFLALKPGR